MDATLIHGSKFAYLGIFCFVMVELSFDCYEQPENFLKKTYQVNVTKFFLSFMTTVDFFCNIFVIYQNPARSSSVLFQVVDTPPMICPFKGVNTHRASSVTFEFFTVCTKLAQMAILYSKHLTRAKKKVTSSGAQPDATDYYWFRSPVP